VGLAGHSARHEISLTVLYFPQTDGRIDLDHDIRSSFVRVRGYRLANLVSSWHCEDDTAYGDLFWPRHPLLTGGTRAAEGIPANAAIATSKRGCVIESMYVTLSRNESQQNFNGVYGDEKFVRGSGLFVGETGVAANHHFLAPRDGSHFRFVEGRYRMQVFAQLLGARGRAVLFSQTLDVDREMAEQLRQEDCGLYFDWGPDSLRYLPHVAKRPALPNQDFLDLMGLMRRSKSDLALESFRQTTK
jgi:hypothetical protein